MFFMVSLLNLNDFLQVPPLQLLQVLGYNESDKVDKLNRSCELEMLVGA